MNLYFVFQLIKFFEPCGCCSVDPQSSEQVQVLLDVHKILNVRQLTALLHEKNSVSAVHGSLELALNFTIIKNKNGWKPRDHLCPHHPIVRWRANLPIASILFRVIQLQPVTKNEGIKIIFNLLEFTLYFERREIKFLKLKVYFIMSY